MKHFTGLSAFLGYAACAFGALDPGGVSLDFAGIEPPAEKVRGKSLVGQGGFEEADINVQTLKNNRNRWGGNLYVHGGTAENKKQIAPSGIRRIVTENPASGKQCLLLRSPAAIQKLRDEKGRPMISNRISQLITLAPADHPVKYRVSFKIRGKLENVAGLNGFYGFAECWDNLPYKGKRLTPMIQKSLSVPSGWETRTFDFMAPAGTAAISFSLALYGIGEVCLDDVEMVPVASAPGVTGKLFPAGMLDRIFALAPGQPGSMAFVLKNEPDVKIESLHLRLTLPKGFRVLDVGNTMRLISGKTEQDGSTTFLIDITSFRNTIQKDRYNTWNIPAVLVETDLKPGETLYPASYQFFCGDYRSVPESFRLQVLEPVKAAAPRRFRSAGMIANDWNYEKDGVAPLAAFYRDSGFNCVHGGNGALGKALKKLGIERYTQPYYSCNGYQIGREKKPENAVFRLVDGQPYVRSSAFQDICPTEVYRKGEYFRKYVIPMYEKILVDDDAAEHIMPNWELHMFDFKGCFCSRCRDEFIEYAAGRLKPEEIRAKWPGKIIAAFRDEWIRFRSMQHARILETLENTVNHIGKKAGKESHFIPEIAWSSMIDYSRGDYGQYDVVDYMGKLPWLEPWGPYIFHSASQPYEYFPGIHLITYLAGRDIQDFVTAHLDKGACRPKLIAFPHGSQLEDWFTEPEAIGFEFLCFFLNGWDGAFAYRFPRGYDQRYWRAAASANNDIATHENFVYDGSEVSARVEAVPETPLPKPFFPVFWNEGGNFMQKIKGLDKASILQWKAFEHQGRFLIAVGNFWQKGENFCKVKFAGIAPDVSYEAALNGVSMGRFSGKQLADGILAHVGALRWSFITLTPSGAEAAQGAVLTQERLRTEMERRLPSIQVAMKWERDYAEKVRSSAEAENPHNDFSMVYPISNSGAALKAVREDGRDYLEITAAHYRALIDPAHGGRIAEWTAAGIPLTGQDRKLNLSMAVDAVWWPAKAAGQITSGYRITGMRAASGGVEVTLERTVGKHDSLPLAGLKIRKTYLFTADAVTVSTCLSNPTDHAVEFSFRYHNLPAFLSSKGTRSGNARFGDGQTFTRDLIHKLYHFAAPDPDLESSRMDKKLRTASSEVTFSAPWSDVRITAEVPPDQLQCFVFWDSGKQQFSTFEPIFRKVNLSPGRSVTYSLKWRVEKGK